MEIGIKEAKNNLSSLVIQAKAGERVFLTNRGERVAELVPVQSPMAPSPNRGRGSLKGIIKVPKDWRKWKRESTKAVMRDMGLL